jgi:resolvase
MKVGYVRVSTVEQHEERQTRDLTEAGAEQLFLDKLSGKDTNRPALQEMMKFVRSGDTVLVSEFSRLARNTKDLLDIVQTLQDKGVTVISRKESLDTSTAQGRMMLTVIGAMVEFERALMLQRQKEGIAIAKEQGKYKGRQQVKKPEQWQEWREQYQTRQITATRLAELCGVSRPVVYKWLKEPICEV